MAILGNNQQIVVLPIIQGVNICKDSDKFNTYIRDYWNYYLKLEEEFIATEKYVEFHKDNYKTYSLEFLKLFQAVCSEIDVVGKMMAAEIYDIQGTNFDPKDATIQKWWFPIQYNYQRFGENDRNTTLFFNKKVTINEVYEMQPWKSFEVEKCRSITHVGNSNSTKEYIRLKQDGLGKTIATTPSWWNAYNDVKHQRTTAIKGSFRTNFSKANLWNLSNAFAALYILEWSYIWAIGTLPEITGLKYSALFETLHD
ncbi:hypothetical protein [Butyrivibrio fibrisolvens]|uniref:hypothetical protein n=1 Tax=Butyrivibrio fibrisolvens TaxID=831 RepID=UPI00040BEE41|nr:hypothetical protein [Butyrivibrio fibrisolvens]